MDIDSSAFVASLLLELPAAALLGATGPQQAQQVVAAAAAPAFAGLTLATSPVSAAPPESPHAAAPAQPRHVPQPKPAPRLFPRTAASAGPRFVGRIAVQSLAGATQTCGFDPG